nr:two-component regulator propeller domain-containing protein [uncultured Carboxylicivirga sp.]
MRDKLVFITIILSFFLSSLKGETTITFSNLTTKDGLSQNTISSIIQDDQGFLWFGSLNGLNRYDGYEFMCLNSEYGNANTLTDSRIKNIIEDAYGYLWITTNTNNINCYDTQNEKFVEIHPWSIQHEKIKIVSNGDIWLWGNKSNCLRITHTSDGLSTRYFGFRELEAHSVNFLNEDKNNIIWIGTKSHLLYLEREEIYKIDEINNILSIIESEDYLFVFTQNKQIYQISKNTKRITKTAVSKFINEAFISNTFLYSNHFLITTNHSTYLFNSESLSIKPATELFGNNIPKNANILTDNKGNCWLYNKSGILWQYNADINKFTPFRLMPPSIISNIDLERYSIYQDSRNIIWITTYGNGLFAIFPDQTVKHFTQDDQTIEGLKTNYLLSIFEDKSGNIWIGSENAGITKISISQNQHPAFIPEKNSTDINDKIIRSIFEDSDKCKWIGTKSGKLYIYNSSNELISSHNLIGGSAYCITEDKDGNKWVGTKGNGLLLFKKDDYKHYTVFNSEFKHLDPLATNIYCIFIDYKNRMWLGTFGYGIILAEFNNNKLVLKSFPHLSKKQDRIRTIEQDKNGLLWVGGNNGIVVFAPDDLINNSAIIHSFTFDKNNPNSLNNNEVKTIFKDINDTIWIGTSGGGINKVTYDKNKKILFKHITTHHGLINDVVQGISQDIDQNLWITTEDGISILNTKNNQFENYDLSNKWQDNLFCESAIYCSHNNQMLMGSYNGLYTISHDDIEQEKVTNSKISLTEIRINGTKILANDENQILSNSLSKTSNINLKYNQNSINIKFSALNFSLSNTYSFILDGYEESWNTSTKYHEAKYRNLPPGNYIFRVKSMLAGEKNTPNETILHIKIQSPFWKSTQAIIFYLISLILIFYITTKTQKRISNLNTAIKLEHQLTDYKLRFFTNISHEFRTPLTIITSIVDSLRNHPDATKELNKQFSYLEKSSKRLLKLINQLLDYRSLQANQTTLKTEQTEVVSFMNDIFVQFEEIANKKHICYQFSSNFPVYEISTDKGKVEKILYNLLSNAFKFVSPSGIIDVKIHISPQNNKLTFSVSDNGIGISSKDQKTLFKRFQQIRPTETGTGIGLNFAHELVTLLDGTISYKDTPNGGATFIVSIPLNSNNSNITHSLSSESITQLNNETIDSTLQDTEPIKTDSKYEHYNLLIIEDDDDISEYLLDYLSQYFSVEVAVNGVEGLKKCKSLNPQIIICDAMMPIMNGFDVIKEVRNNFETCHIPVVMLTAYSTPEHQLLGIKSGADAYITKPFNNEFLLTRIIKLLEQRETLQKKFMKEPGISANPKLAVDKDNRFIKQINSIIEQNIDNPEFSIEDFYEHMNMGRTLFYKKVKSLTNYTPNEYLRVIRLKRAAELLLTTDLNVSEVSYRVGNNNPFYFSKCFKNHFGVSPSEYSKHHPVNSQ